MIIKWLVISGKLLVFDIKRLASLSLKTNYLPLNIIRVSVKNVPELLGFFFSWSFFSRFFLGFLGLFAASGVIDGGD